MEIHLAVDVQFGEVHLVPDGRREDIKVEGIVENHGDEAKCLCVGMVDH
jgi:hypothetical protein